jgi:hypothetical protein
MNRKNRSNDKKKENKHRGNEEEMTETRQKSEAKLTTNTLKVKGCRWVSPNTIIKTLHTLHISMGSKYVISL